jgi:hypothetical protein
LDRIPLRVCRVPDPEKNDFESPERNLDTRILGAHHIQIASHDGQTHIIRAFGPNQS